MVIARNRSIIHIFGLASSSLVGLFVFHSASVGLISTFFDGNIMDLLLSSSKSLDTTSRRALLLVLGMSSIGAFIVGPHFYVRYAKMPLGTKTLLAFPIQKYLNFERIASFALVVLIVIAFLPVNAQVIEWNQSLQLPEYLSGLENWMRTRENTAADITTQVTQMDTLLDFFITLTVIAGVAAVAEEFFFRGLIQSQLRGSITNPHAAVWISALVFSFFHLQFYGFVPRLLLGALFGYLYLFSGNLWVAILAHFSNNAVVLSVTYLQRSTDSLQILDTTTAPSGWISWGAGLAMGAFIYAFYWTEQQRTHRRASARLLLCRPTSTGTK